MSCAVVPQATYLANGSSQQHHQVGHYYYLLLLLVFLGSLDLSVDSLTLGNILVNLYVRDSIELATAPTVQPLKFDNPEQFKIVSTSTPTLTQRLSNCSIEYMEKWGLFYLVHSVMLGGLVLLMIQLDAT